MRRSPLSSGKLGKQIAASHVTLVDDGAAPGLMGSKGITDEGLPTGRTILIQNGVLTGLLTNWYESQRIQKDPKAKEKLGVDPAKHVAALKPRNGFRFGGGGGRHFGRSPGIFPTNVCFESAEAMTSQEWVRSVQNGLYIGRIWYTYPINGLAAGDFTCTVVGDSFVIKDGRLAKPIRPNTLRINESIHQIRQNITGMTKEGRGTLVWAADEVVHAPEIAVSGVHMTEIAQFLAAGS